jgi:sulfotransferase famil protein
MAETGPVLISCHIGKTGGTSFRAMLQAAHGDRLVFITRMPAALPIRRELYPLLRRMYWYARSFDSHDLRYVPPNEFWAGARFAVILRDPAERFLSEYFFLQYHTGQALGPMDESHREAWLKGNFPSLEVFLEDGTELQTKFIAGASFIAPATREIFADAVRELEHYDYIGLTECADKLPAVIAADFPELRQAGMPVENVTPNRGGTLWRDRIEPKLLEKVRARHTFDFKLYEAAVELNRRRGHPVP